VDKFCYLGDMLSVDGDADAAVETRIRIGWNKLRQLDHCLQIGIYQWLWVGDWIRWQSRYYRNTGCNGMGMYCEK